MISQNTVMIAAIAGAIGAAIGSLPRQGSPWKGPVAFGAMYAASLAQAAYLPEVNPIIGFIAAALVFAIVGGALRMKPVQISTAFIGSILLPIIVLAFAQRPPA